MFEIDIGKIISGIIMAGLAALGGAFVRMGRKLAAHDERLKSVEKDNEKFGDVLADINGNLSSLGRSVARIEGKLEGKG